jgi:hypothetical protein
MVAAKQLSMIVHITMFHSGGSWHATPRIHMMSIQCIVTSLAFELSHICALHATLQ